MVMDDDSRPAGGVEEICRTGAGQTGEGEGEGGGVWSDPNPLGIGHQQTIGIAKVIGHGQIHIADVSREGATRRGDKGWGMDGPTIRSNTASSDRRTEISLKEGQALNRTDRRAGQFRGKALIGDNEDIGHNLDSAQDARRKVEAPQHTCAPQHTLPKRLPRPLHADSAVAIARVQEQQVPENEEFFVRSGIFVPSVPTLVVTLNSLFPEEDRVSDPAFLPHSVVSSNRPKSVPVPISTSSPLATSLASAASRSSTGTASIRTRVYSPYQIPLSSSRSTMDSMRIPSQRSISAFPPTDSPPENDYEPTTPPRHANPSSAKTERQIYHSPGVGRIASPAGSMSTGSRRRPSPAWPTSARRVSDDAAAEANAAAEAARAGVSHREILARSPGLAQYREGGQGGGIVSPTPIPPISGFTSTQSRPVPLSAGRAIPHGYVVMRNASGERYNHPVYQFPPQVGQNGLLAQPMPSSGPQRSPGLLGPRGPLTPVYSPISPNRPPRGHPYYTLVSPMPAGSYPYRPTPVQHGSQVPVMVPIARYGLSPGYPISPPYLPQNRSLQPHPVQHTHPSHPAQPGSARAAGFSASAPVQNGQLPPLSPTVKNEIFITPRGTVKYTPVSQAWAISGLNKRARWDWYKPETTDCWVVCPIWSVLNKRQEARAKAKAEQAAMEAAGSVTSEPNPADGKTSEMHIDHGADSGVSDKKAGGFKEGDDIMSAQRQVNGKESQRDQIPVIMIPLHREYLLTQVKVFRYLLNEHEKTKDIDDDQASTTSRPPTDGSAERVTRRRLIEFEGDPDPTQDLPPGLMRESKCLPVPKGDKPVLYCPIPDPGAFGIIVRYLYWGDLREVEDALSRGIVSWQGLVYNIDFLDLDDGIKRCVGNWWRKWIKTETQSTTGRNLAEDSSDDEEEETQRAKSVKSSPRGSRGRTSKSLVEPESGVESDGFEGDNEGEGDEGVPRKPKGPSPAKRDAMEVDEGVEEVTPRRGRGKRVPGLATPSGSGVGSKAEDKAKRWVRGDGEVDEGVVGRLRNL